MTKSNILLKSQLTPDELTIVKQEFDKKSRNKILTFVIWILLGVFGAHRVYLKNYWRAFFMFITGGGCGVWWIIDAFFLNGRLEELNDEIELEIIQEVLNNRAK